MNNTHNYSFLLNAKAQEPTQHFAFEKGGTVIRKKVVESKIEKQNSVKIFFKNAFFFCKIPVRGS